MTTQMITRPRPEQPRLLTPAEVAALFRVEVKTVTRWANAGLISSIRTVGGHRRFPEREVLAVLRAGTMTAGSSSSSRN